MGCRSFLGVWKRDGEQVHDGRNNLGVISLNLPRIALEQGDETEFWKRCSTNACSWRVKR